MLRILFNRCALIAMAALVAVSWLGAQPKAPAGYVALFNGKDIKNFDIRSGHAKYPCREFRTRRHHRRR